MLRLLVKNVQVERIAPHVYSLCVNWIDPVAARPDTGLIYTGSSPMQRWSTEEEETLRAIYPQGEKQEILQIFPDSSWDIIVKRASKLGIKRKCSHTRLESDPFYRWTAYNDWIKTCEYYGIEQEKEREEILEMLLNYSAKTKKQELVFLWLLPAAKITLRAQLESIEGNIMTHILGGNKSSATSP